MDDTNNKTGVREQSVPSSQPAVTQPSPVGLAPKEQAPISSKVVSEISKIIEVSEKEPHVPKDVIEAGVKQVSDRFHLTKGHTDVGIQHAGESTQFPSQPPEIKIEEVKKGLQISPAYSARWLAELGKKVLKRFGWWKEK